MTTGLSELIPNYILVKFIFVFNYHPEIINAEPEAQPPSSLNLLHSSYCCPHQMWCPLHWIPRAKGPLLGKKIQKTLLFFKGVSLKRLSWFNESRFWCVVFLSTSPFNYSQPRINACLFYIFLSLSSYDFITPWQVYKEYWGWYFLVSVEINQNPSIPFLAWTISLPLN